MLENDTSLYKEKFCCICFCEDHLQDIFLSSYLKYSLYELAKIYMDRATHDCLKTICMDCIKYLIRTHNFLSQCKEASKCLSSYVFPLKSTQNSKLLLELKSTLFLRKYNLTESEGTVRAYITATCDNNVISDDDLTEYNENVKVIDRTTDKVKKKRPLKKHFRKCAAKYLNDLTETIAKENSEGKLYKDDLHIEHLNNTNLVYDKFNDIRLTDESIKLESNATVDTEYSDDDDLPLIIHRDRSLAVTAQDDVTNELRVAKNDKDVIRPDFNAYFNQENISFNCKKCLKRTFDEIITLPNIFLDDEDNFFYSSDNHDDLMANLPLKKKSKNLKRKSGTKKFKTEPITCYICDVTFGKKSQWRHHLKTEHPNIRNNEYVSCDICGKQLKVMCMKSHIKNVHQGKILKNKFLCPICGKLYNANQRRRHTLLHDTPKPYQCEHCTFRCSQRGNLRRHQRRHTGEKPYLCTVCAHGASQKGTLLEHMKSHEVLPTPVSCVFCQLEFATSFEYRRHRRVHKNDIATDKVQNGSGGQKGTTAGGESLDESRNGGRVTLDSNLVCPICKKQLMSESGFKCHVRAHKESGRYSCHHCSKSFTSKATLEYHIRIHTGEKPYRCTVCPKQFKQPGHLTAHMAIHANRREHRCTFCDQTFNIKFNLVEHLRIHTGDTIDCEFCGKKFRHNSNRRKHIRETHPRELKAVQT